MGKAVKYNEEELNWIEKNKELLRREAHEQFSKKFKRPDVSFDNYNALCKRKKWLTGRTGHFKKNTPAWNKGKKMPFNPNAAKTQFKKGQQPHNTKYIGHERVSRCGYVEISVYDENLKTPSKRKYVLKHRWLWEQQHGPLPEGMCLKSLDGNKTNTDPENWTPISRSMLPRLNGVNGRNYDQADQSLKPLIMNVTKLEHEAREKKNAKREEA